MRPLTDHIVEGDSVNHKLSIIADHFLSSGGAPYEYAISWEPPNEGEPDDFVLIRFHVGSPQEVGVNGVTNEALLAIVIDRLRSFQSGPFACRDNAVALTYCEEALMWLQRRTRERIKRGVEGTTQK